VTLRLVFRDTTARLDALGREALALARQATLLRHDLSVVVPPRGGDVAVLVHGFLATAGVLRPLREALESDAGVTVASFTHAPGVGVTGLARRVSDLVRRLDAERIHLVGHSIGGLAARWFVEELGGDRRVVQTVSIASPFWGVRRARLLPGVLGRELAPESAVLTRLRASVRRGVPHFAVSGSHDAVVGPPAPLGSEDEIVAHGCGHNAVLYDPVVLRAVVGRLRSERPGRQAAAERL
jgi:pimeloyl-ACP methyl ester carboxylesterase